MPLFRKIEICKNIKLKMKINQPDQRGNNSKLILNISIKKPNRKHLELIP